MRIGIVQPDIVWEDKPRNYERVRGLVSGLGKGALDLVVLPEMFATGFSMDLARVKETAKGETSCFLKGLARDLDAHVLGGFVEEKGSKGLNTVALFDPRGTEVLRYVKMHPFTFGGEDRRYHRGEGPCVARVNGVMVAPFICYDLRFPEVFREAMALGAEVFVVPANWPNSRISHFTALLRARAIENLGCAIGVNRIGHGGGLDYDGHSVIFGPLGEELASAGDREEVAVCELDVSVLRKTREQLGFLTDARSDRYPHLQAERSAEKGGVRR
jgi:predicted amidohydrolase